MNIVPAEIGLYTRDYIHNPANWDFLNKTPSNVGFTPDKSLGAFGPRYLTYTWKLVFNLFMFFYTWELVFNLFKLFMFFVLHQRTIFLSTDVAVEMPSCLLKLPDVSSAPRSPWLGVYGLNWLIYSTL